MRIGVLMAVQGSLYGGFVKGKARPIVLGPNNPQIDNSTTQLYASKKFAVEKGKKGVKRHPQVDGVAQRVRTQAGRKQGGSMTIKGGTF
jgi:hypothetical protein